MVAVLDRKNQLGDIVGTYRSFGATGPAYHVRQALRELENGDRLMEIEVLTTGEVLEYPATQICADPIAK
ncbi:MAG: DUF5397 family protein [Burkholderiales bacterium]